MRSPLTSRSSSSTTTRTQARTTEDDETSRLEGDLVDLEPLLRDAVVLALPFQPLCQDDCPGLCAECGADWRTTRTTGTRRRSTPGGRRCSS